MCIFLEQIALLATCRCSSALLSMVTVMVDDEAIYLTLSFARLFCIAQVANPAIELCFELKVCPEFFLLRGMMYCCFLPPYWHSAALGLIDKLQHVHRQAQRSVEHCSCSNV